MTDYSYDIKLIKDRLLKQATECKTTIDLWNNVKFRFKKDGKPFANLDKCFDGATYSRLRYTEAADGRNELRVYGAGVIDSINAFIGIEHATEEQKKRTDRLFGDKHYPVYELTFEELRDAIYKHIAFLQDRLEALKFQYEHVEYIYNHYMEQLTEATKELRMLCNYNGSDCVSGDILESAQHKLRWL